MSARLRIRETGPLCLVEDLGRSGVSGIGVGRSGAADRASLKLANRLLANPETHAALEVTLGGLELEVLGSSVSICVTGAPVPVRVDGEEVGSHRVVGLRPGSQLSLGSPVSGLRCYLGVRGGIEVPAVLGSRSHDVMAGLGPPPVRAGDELPVGAAGDGFPILDEVPVPAYDAPARLRVVRGPRDDRVRDVETLVRSTWTAAAASNRIGMRLDGARIEHRGGCGELPSEGAIRGAIQVPPSGEPVVFLADHPVTGGYPVVAVVVDADVDRAAQVRPGESLQFRWAEP